MYGVSTSPGHESEMIMDFAYTRHQKLRGAKPDAEVGDKMYLLKNVSNLRLTYQIRLLTFMANARGKTLIIQIPKTAKVDESLKRFVSDSGGLAKVQRA